jgi:monofunctional biosynthetic peptidoglycan transglycosylase
MDKTLVKDFLFYFLLDILNFFIKNTARLLILFLIVAEVYLCNYDLNASIIVLRLILFCLTLKILGLLSLNWINPPTSAFMLQTANSCSDQERNDIDYVWVDYEKISLFMPLAVIAAEDYNFPKHSGFAWAEILEAWKANKNDSSCLRGGSSISQQTVKNLFLYPKKNFGRKLLEAYLTILFEVVLTKKRILEIYLNIVQFSPNIFGVEAASLYFFNKSAQYLTAEDASILASVLPNPYIYNVENPSKYVRQKQNDILNKMRKMGAQKLHVRFFKRINGSALDHLGSYFKSDLSCFDDVIAR